MPLYSLMLRFMTRFAVKREMCKNLDSRSQYLSEVLGFLEASYGMDMCEVVPEEGPCMY